MSSSAFEPVAHATIDSLGIEFTEYLHAPTGARHYHLGCDDPNNAFMVAFPTLPQDSSGVAHILEQYAAGYLVRPRARYLGPGGVDADRR